MIVWAGVPVAIGYNLETGGLSCDSGECPRGLKSYEEQPAEAPYDDCVAVHAEVRALRDFAAFAETININPEELHWVEQMGEESLMYISEKPCGDCRLALEWAGLRAVWV